MREHGYTQEALAERLGKDRTTIANALRLLKLPPRVRAKVVAGELTRGTRARCSARATRRAIEQLAEQGRCAASLSVRATEALVRAQRRARRATGAARSRRRDGKSASVRDLETRLTRAPRDEGRGARPRQQGRDRDPLRRPRRARPAHRKAPLTRAREWTSEGPLPGPRDQATTPRTGRSCLRKGPGRALCRV